MPNLRMSNHITNQLNNKLSLNNSTTLLNFILLQLKTLHSFYAFEILIGIQIQILIASKF